jgi:hypothetical protein
MKIKVQVDTSGPRRNLQNLRDALPSLLAGAVQDAAAIALARAFQKIPQADPDRILNNLRRQVGKTPRNPPSPWAGTLAAAIQAKLRRQQGLAKLPAAQFFREVEKDIWRRTQNVGITRAALQPAADALGASLPFTKRFPRPLGGVSITETPKTRVEISTWANAINETAPDALDDGLAAAQYHLLYRIPRLIDFNI